MLLSSESNELAFSFPSLMTALCLFQETDDGGADEEDDHKHSHRSKSEVDGQDDSDESVGVIFCQPLISHTIRYVKY